MVRRFSTLPVVVKRLGGSTTSSIASPWARASRSTPAGFPDAASFLVPVTVPVEQRNSANVSDLQ
jgi:hypothetical protein